MGLQMYDGQQHAAILAIMDAASNLLFSPSEKSNPTPLKYVSANRLVEVEP